MKSGDYYQLYGRKVWSDTPLHAPSHAPCDPDHRFLRGEPRTVTADTPAGTLVHLYRYSDTFGMTLTRHAAGYTLRFHYTCDFEISADLRRITWHADEKTDPELVPLFITGTVIAALLMLQGETTMHASAVQVGRHAIAFVGQSGAGKSTLAALLCGQPGVSLLCDDLLRLAPSKDGLLCHSGCGEVRLRSQAASLADGQEGGGSYTTPDKRTAFIPPLRSTCLPKLAAIVCPVPRRELLAPKVERLTARQALFELLHHPRIYAWTEDGACGKTQFAWFASVAKAVPVYKAELPWGPPFDPRVAQSLWDLPATVDIEDPAAREAWT